MVGTNPSLLQGNVYANRLIFWLGFFELFAFVYEIGDRLAGVRHHRRIGAVFLKGDEGQIGDRSVDHVTSICRRDGETGERFACERLEAFVIGKTFHATNHVSAKKYRKISINIYSY